MSQRLSRRTQPFHARVLAPLAWRLALSGWALCAACVPNAASTQAVPLPVASHPLSGAPAPDFELPARSGDALGLKQYAGRVVLLDFWATWCQPCRASFPRYEELATHYGERVAVLGISEDDSDAEIDAFLRETGARFRVAWDADKSVARRYRIEGMPMLFIIDASGLVRFVHTGFHPGDESRIGAAIDSLL